MLLERVAEERLGADGARRAVLYLALFPTALFLQAVYSESLFLFLSLAAFMLAERRRFGWAGVVVGLAVLTRPTGLALVPPLVLLARRQSWRLATALPFLFALPARALARRRRSVGVRARGGNVEPAPLAGRPARRDLGRRARGLGRSRAARLRLELARLLDRGRARGLDALAHRRAQPRAVRVPRALRRARRDRVARVRRALRAFRGPEPGAAAERPELALAAALAAALRARRLPVLPRARVARRPAPRAHAAIVGCSALLLGVFVTQWALWDWVA